MGEGLKLLLSKSLEALEQGAFQEFCLSFLPLYNKKYKGLERHGATAAGKTRKGTPDLLKTGEQGEQIAVQCSTEEDYWTPPSAYENWKPIKDITKCTDALKSLEEIVLCSNREISPSRPNAKSEIITWATSKTTAKITLLSLSNFEEEILQNTINYSVVIERHLSEFNAFLEPFTSHITLKLFREHSAPLEAIQEIVKRVAQSIKGEHADYYSEARELVSSLKSRFQRSQLPEKGEINRTPALNDLVPDTLGKIVGITGIPKIGKTTWVSQYCHLLDHNDIEVLWFETPIHNQYVFDFFADVTRTILGRLCGPKVGNEFAEGKIYLYDLSSLLSTLSKPSKKLQVIIDNADRIPTDQLKEIHLLFTTVKKSWEGNELGIIFVGNRSLKSEGVLLDAEIRCPNWSDNEIKQLLTINGIQVEGDLDKFCELLTSFSGGHPLVALATARQFPSISGLLSTVFPKGPALYDQELTDEVTTVLFNDLLPDPDLRNLVLHISSLIYPAKLPLLFHLGENLTPPLRDPVSLLIEKLKGTILEGDDSVGYQVPHIFQKVSGRYRNPDIPLKIFKAASGFLLSPKGKVIDLNNITEGITYAIFGGDLASALHWTNIILYNASRKLNDVQLRSFLERIWIVEALRIPKDDSLKLLYAITLSQMAIAYRKIGDSQRSIKLASGILKLGIEKLEPPDDVPYLHYSFTSVVRIHLILDLSTTGQINEALRELNKIKIEHFKYLTRDLPGELRLVELAEALISKGNIGTIPKEFLLSLVKATEPNDNQVIGALASCFCHIGLLICKEDGNVNDILKSDEGAAIPLWYLFVKVAHSEYQMEKKHSDVSIELIDQIESEASLVGVNSNLLMAKLAQMKGDALFQSGNLPEAQKEYHRSIDFLPKGEATFDHAWAHFRIGECTNSESDAFSAFTEASRILEMVGLKNLASRARGEMAILCYRRKDYKGLVSLIDGLTTDYYLNKCHECGPSVVIGLPLVLRLNEELGYPNAHLDEQQIDGKILPTFERGIFIRVLDLAKPSPGICTAFFTIGLSYQLLNEIDHCIRCFRMSFEATPVVEPDQMAKITAGSFLTNALLLRDGQDLDKVTTELLTLVELSEKISDPIRISIVFGKAEENLRKGLISKTSFHKLLDHFEQAITSLKVTRKPWWLAEIFKRKAGIDSVTPEPEYYPKHLRKSWEYALEGNNFSILTEVGHLLGFRFVHEAKSVKEVAEIQLSVILGIINDERNIERVETLGSNMAAFWKNLRYRRIAESDLPFLANLRDSAQRMERQNTPVSLRSPLMILSLLKTTGNIHNKKFDKALEWALDKLQENWDKVPEEERMFLKDKT